MDFFYDTGSALGALAGSGPPTGDSPPARTTSSSTSQEIAESLSEENARLAREAQTKDRILALVTHELRTPLTPIVMLSQMLVEQGGFDEETHDALATIHGNALLAARLISDLLDLSKVHYGKLQMHFEPVDLHAIIHQAAATVSFDAQERSISLSAELVARSHTVEGDVDRLTQTVLNLLTNAVKFTGHGGAVSIRTWNLDDGRMAMAVADTGIGIDPQRLPWLFDPFYQAPEEHDAPRHGLGLGLAISRMLVEAHGGTLTATSEGVGRGATFEVVLPVID